MCASARGDLRMLACTALLHPDDVAVAAITMTLSATECACEFRCPSLPRCRRAGPRGHRGRPGCHRTRRRASTRRQSPVDLVGAGGALVALALLLAASVDSAVLGTFCSWPQSVRTLSGLGLIVTVLPALVAIRQTLRRERRSVAYWVMVGTAISAIGLYMWLLTGANHPCPGGFVSDALN